MRAKPGLPQSFTSCRSAVRAEVKTVMDSCPSALGKALRYHMGWQDKHGHPCTKESGKFIRSTLCLLSCQAVGGDTSQAMPAAAAIELIHNFSLIHDDIEDASCERHHRPTVWKLWGESQAINAGDAMFTLAYLALLKLRERGIADEKVASSIEMLSMACLELCEGQYLDIQYENRLDISIEDYVSMAGKKTGSLFAASTSLGAYLGGGDDGLVDLLHLFGKELGIAFQIRDDVLGIWASEKSIGKSTADISQRKKTLPLIYGLQNSVGEARKRLERLYSQESIEGNDIVEVRKILERSGARDYAENFAEQHYCRALTHLGAAQLDASRQAPLEEAAYFLLNRDF